MDQMCIRDRCYLYWVREHRHTMKMSALARRVGWTAALLGWSAFAFWAFSPVSYTHLFIVLRGPIQLIVGSSALAVLVFLGSAYLIHSASIFVSPLMPMTVIAVLFALFTTTRFAIEKRQAYAWFKMLANARQLVMESMAAVAETRHPETGAHIRRTQNYVRAIAEKLRCDGHYTEILTHEFIDLLFVSAPLHDIGKVGIPDSILLKSDRLTPPEFELMKKHAEYGRNIICSAAQRLSLIHI